MLKYIGDTDKDLSKYGFSMVVDKDVMYIHRSYDGNAYIGDDGSCLSIRNKRVFDKLIEDGLVIEEEN